MHVSPFSLYTGKAGVGGKTRGEMLAALNSLNCFRAAAENIRCLFLLWGVPLMIIIQCGASPEPPPPSVEAYTEREDGVAEEPKMDPNMENAMQNQINGASKQCFILNITTSNGIWHGDNPFTESLPLIIKQFAAILILTRSLYHLLKPLHQPRIVSDILVSGIIVDMFPISFYGGILLGPSALGNTTYFANLFPTKNFITIETIAYMSLLFHVFLVGLELDLSAIRRISKKAICFTVTGLFVPLAMGIVLFYLLHPFSEQNQPHVHEVTVKGSFLRAAALSVTNFPVVSRIILDLKLLKSDIGRLAMPIALISDIGSWVLIAILIPLTANPTNAPYVITTTAAYVLASIYIIRPFLAWSTRRTSNGNNNGYSDFYLCFVLVGVVLGALLTDVTGSHPIVGAFIFGLITPNELVLALMERFEYFVSGLMMPVFLVISGMKVDLFKITQWMFVLLIVIMLCAVKIISFLPMSLVSDIDPKDSFAVGLLMSTKGIWAILIINTGLDKEVLPFSLVVHDEDYAVMMVTILLMTSIVAPTIAAIYKGTKLTTEYYNRRTIQQDKTESELRILTCIYSFCNVPGILKLLDVSHAIRHNHITVFTLHLVELTDCESAPMLIVHDSHHKFDNSIYHPDYGDSSEMDQIVNAFREYEIKTRNISVQSFSAVSPFVAVDGNICSLAEDKNVAFLILPFHKRANIEGNLEEGSSAFRNINQNVLLNAPCSVGIFIDRGLEEVTDTKVSNEIHEIVMVFLGGADDCEALAYAWRMAKHPEVSLTVIRLLEMDSVDLKGSIKSSSSYLDKLRQIDDDYINEFRLQTGGEELIVYEEKILQNGEELVVTLKEIENKFDLFIVGRGEGIHSPLTTELLNWVDCPELGVIGDLLATSETARGSVLVVQQFFDFGNSIAIEDLVGTPRMYVRDAKEIPESVAINGEQW
ncbi:cation/H(+) antiporter 15-like [Durio zibethinus]|uniref:Cation/H(+) antiporter 15-like n=1 Tax=Durio zibethinus TaxID=66656 RepID=A0A6P5WGP3_DURZI|nr:cation/H(+) antiporter 15-like [Durio zibethinus]